MAAGNLMSMRLTVLITMLMISPLALAEPVHMACKGEMTTDGGHVQKLALSLTIDRGAGTLTVQDHGSVKIRGQQNDTVLFSGPSSDYPNQTILGTINRVTGETVIAINIGPGMGQRFVGTCDTARPKF